MPYALLFLTMFIPVTLLASLACLAVAPFDRSGRLLHGIGQLWARLGLGLARVRLVTSGAELIPRKQPVIFMGNHQGNFDILALYGAIPGQFRWLAKEELFRYPFFGAAMRRAGHLPVNRDNPRQAANSITAAAERIRTGTSVAIFPEGTRSPDEELLPFKRGGFQLAARAGVPIVPVKIDGSHRINPSTRLALRPGTISVRFGAPLLPGDTSPERLMELTRTAIITLGRG